MLDLFGRLPGRGAHVCPDVACLARAVDRNAFGRALRAPVKQADPIALAQNARTNGYEQVKAMLATCLRSGWLIPGKQNVLDAIQAGRVALLLLATDAGRSLAEDMKRAAARTGLVIGTCLSHDDLSHFHGGKLLSILAITHRGLAKRISSEIEKGNLLSISLEQWFKKTSPGLTGRKSRGKMSHDQADSSKEPVGVGSIDG